MTTSTHLIRMPALRQKLGGVGRTTVYELIAGRQFPVPINLGPRAVAWLESEVDAWIAERMAERPENEGRAEAAA